MSDIIVLKYPIFEKLTNNEKQNIKLIYVFGKSNAFIVKNDDQVFALGENSYGLLGFGDEKQVENLTIVNELCGKKVVDFRNGSKHVIARTLDGKVFCWGSNDYGLLGNAKKLHMVYKPEVMTYLTDIVKDVSCGDSHSLALTSNGEVYVWGYIRDEQIDDRSIRICQITPCLVNGFDGEKVKAISCGFKHSMALTESGLVYSWGCNRSAQLGIKIDVQNTEEFVSSPKLIQLNKGVVIEKICCGYEHSLLLSSDGDIYFFGDNHQIIPKLLINTNKFTDIESHYCSLTSAALLDNGIYNYWADSQQMLIKPIESMCNCFSGIFAVFHQITNKTLNIQQILDKNYLSNEKYRKQFNEISQIGTGSYGQVFKVKLKSNDKLFAIKKILIKDLNKSIDEIKSSLQKICSSTDCIIRYYDIWSEDCCAEDIVRSSIVYIQMDLCDNTLKNVQKEIRSDTNLMNNGLLTPLGFYIMSELFIEILEAMNYLHLQNIMHKALKPENILLSHSLNGKYVKISDLGFAKIQEITNHSLDERTLKYMAPEVIRDNTRLDIKADIYSLGVILQKIFCIDFDNSYEDNGNDCSVLMSKYRKVKELFDRMTPRDYNKRPKCGEILDMKNLWAINDSEFDHKNDLKRITEDILKSFLYSMISTKLSNAFK